VEARRTIAGPSRQAYNRSSGTRWTAGLNPDTYFAAGSATLHRR